MSGRSLWPQRTALRRIERSLRASDPGLLRSAQAFKTLLAVLLAWGAVRGLGWQTSFFSALATGFLMQCAVGRTRRAQLAAMAGLGVTMALAAGLGVWLRRSPGASAVLVIAGAFVTFAARAWLPEEPAVTVFPFLVLLLAIALPPENAGQELLAVGGGIGIALAVSFSVLPRRWERGLEDALAAFADAASSQLHRLAGALERTGLDLRELGRGRRRLEQRAAVCRALIAGAPDPPALEPVLVELYGALHAMIDLRQSVEALISAGARCAPLAERIERLAGELADPLGETAATGEGFSFADLAPRSPLPVLARIWIAVDAIRRLDGARSRIASALPQPGSRGVAPRSGGGGEDRGRRAACLPAVPEPRRGGAMRETTRLGLRAAVAAALAEGASRLLSLPRSYWAVFVAVVILNETWGESIEMAVHRLGMTALGCGAGFVLDAVVAAHPLAQRVLLFAGVFWAVYFRKGPGGGSYPWMVFFISVYVVFLFALLGRWSVRGVVLARVYDTAIGCAVALAASVLVPARAAGRRLDAELRALQAACRDLVTDPGAGCAHALLSRLEDLRARCRASGYETLFRGPRRRAAARVSATEELCHASLGLARELGIARERALAPALRGAIAAARASALAALDALETSRQALPDDPGCAGAALVEAEIDPGDLGLVGAVLDHAEQVRRWAFARAVRRD